MKKIMMIGLVLAVAVLASGCASYNPRVGIPDVKTFQETGIRTVDLETGIAIIAYPIQTREDADLYFDNAGIAKKGFLPVYVNISGANKDYRVNIAFIQTENRSIPSVSVETAFKLLKKSYGVEMIAWGVWNYGIGAPISAAHTAFVNSKIEKDLKEKEMKGESGFLYFKIPENLESLDNSFLVFVLTIKDSKDLTVRLPLRGRIADR